MDTDRALSPRQTQMLDLAAAGHTDKEIAIMLGVKTGTLRTYWDRLRTRYDARSRSEVIAKAKLRPPASEFFDFMLKNLPLFIWTSTPEGEVIFKNDWFLGHLKTGTKSSSTIGIRTLMSPSDGQIDREAWLTAKMKGEPYGVSVNLNLGEGFGRQLHKLRMFPVRSDDGSIVKWIGYAREIAESADDRMVEFLMSIAA